MKAKEQGSVVEIYDANHGDGFISHEGTATALRVACKRKIPIDLAGAALDLLEALEVYVKDCPFCHGQGSYRMKMGGAWGGGRSKVTEHACNRCMQARAAIAKARGES